MQAAQRGRPRAADMIVLDESDVDPDCGKRARVPCFREETPRISGALRHDDLNFRQYRIENPHVILLIITFPFGQGGGRLDRGQRQGVSAWDWAKRCSHSGLLVLHCETGKSYTRRCGCRAGELSVLSEMCDLRESTRKVVGRTAMGRTQ